ncbi:MAG: hypothetical protein H8D23_39830 [Candidatus Brocadiales bacterium]|nr:hypothetical protein [Candidatus Brocadiales bacterium]
MEVSERKKYKAIIKAKQKAYIGALSKAQCEEVNFESRLNNLRNKLTHQLRKTDSSANSVKSMPTISRILFGLQEDIVRLSLPIYNFKEEKEVINTFVISFLSHRRETQYDGECKYYGETLLNLYLDIFITLTCRNTPRRIEHKPGFLVNPKTEQLLELDITLEEFLLAFEFQGESHYREQKEMEKDTVKLSKCASNNVILVPVNIYQLESRRLMQLILNSMKDSLGIKSQESGVSMKVDSSLKINPKHIRSYKKACQRIYLAETLFGSAIKWLDEFALRFRDTQAIRNPISSTTEAPRLTKKTNDLEVPELYTELKHV